MKMRLDRCVNYEVYIGEFFTFFHRALTAIDFQHVNRCILIRNRYGNYIFGSISPRSRPSSLGNPDFWPDICQRVLINFISMAKQVIVRMSAPGVWDTLEEAANALQISTATLSRRLRDVDPDLRYASRVYAIKLKVDNEWRVAVPDTTGRKYVLIGQSLAKVGKSAILDVKDITLAWYLKASTVKDF